MDDQQLLLPIDGPLIGKVKSSRTVMFWDFFALCKELVTQLPVYDDGRIRIEVTGTKFGVANIYDKEILIYIVSLMQDKINRGEVVTRRFTFTINDFCRVVGVKAVGTAYSRIEDALRRLQGTQISTNIETGGRGRTLHSRGSATTRSIIAAGWMGRRSRNPLPLTCVSGFIGPCYVMVTC